ncbi:hypothetical protein LN380_25870, partial [Enterobacter hormaechei subsp. steigerwaltii]|uniref:aminoglycoside phosphotransferase family protein n=1 Tax=Enterobacter hormaechei TaxID=158836 RepID=UPI002DDBC55B
VPAYGPQNDVTLKMPAFEWVHVQLHQQKGMISLSPPTICNSAFSRALDVDPRRLLDQAYAYGCLSAAWNADGEEEQRDLAIAAAIKQVRQTSY